MTTNNNYLAIIPARGGSKRLPRKNVLNLNGKPLIGWTIEAALQCQSVNNVLVTSDSDEILAVAQTFGANAIKRPDYLAEDTSTSFDALKHAIENTANYKFVVLLQPTSPLRTTRHIEEAIKFLESKNADAVVSVTEMEHSPLWANTLPADHKLVGFLKEEVINLRSQDLETYYRLNGAIYICRTKKLLEAKSFFLKENIYAYVMDNKSSVDIDTELDFKWADFNMRQYT